MPLPDLRKLWGRSRQRATSQTCEIEAGINSGDEAVAGCSSSREAAQVSLPLLQVWPIQDSPKPEENNQRPRFTFNCEISQQHDSGIESVQASPSPRPSQCLQARDDMSPTPSSRSRRASSIFLHPNHARLIRTQSSSEQPPVEDSSQDYDSSTASSMASISGGQHLSSGLSDQWDRRRSSAITARYSLLDALDLEYALLRAATRNSIGQSSFSHSIHKLTFTQTLAFPALARGLAHRGRGPYNRSSSLNDSSDTGMNAAAKIITVIVLVFTSLLVFGLVFNYVTV